MSAFLVSEETIDCLVASCALLRLDDRLFPELGSDDLGRLLWRANAVSVAHRYNEQPEPTDHYRFKMPDQWGSTQWPKDRRAKLLACAKAWACWSYQTCEIDRDSSPEQAQAWAVHDTADRLIRLSLGLPDPDDGMRDTYGNALPSWSEVPGWSDAGAWR